MRDCKVDESQPFFLFLNYEQNSVARSQLAMIYNNNQIYLPQQAEPSELSHLRHNPPSAHTSGYPIIIPHKYERVVNIVQIFRKLIVNEL